MRICFRFLRLSVAFICIYDVSNQCPLIVFFFCVFFLHLENVLLYYHTSYIFMIKSQLEIRFLVVYFKKYMSLSNFFMKKQLPIHLLMHLQL